LLGKFWVELLVLVLYLILTLGLLSIFLAAALPSHNIIPGSWTSIILAGFYGI
jgi:hypothetical protein